MNPTTPTHRNARLSRIALTRVEHEVGLGVEDDPVRTIIELHDDRGRLVAEWDTRTGAGRAVHPPTT